MKYSEFLAQELKQNFYIDVENFHFKILVHNNKVEKIVFEAEIDGISCVYTTGDKNISCSKKGTWFHITPPKYLKDIINKEPSAIKNLFKKNENLIFWDMNKEQVENFKERNSFLFK
jgi:hypothetical protein